MNRRIDIDKPHWRELQGSYEASLANHTIRIRIDREPEGYAIQANGWKLDQTPKTAKAAKAAGLRLARRLLDRALDDLASLEEVEGIE